MNAPESTDLGESFRTGMESAFGDFLEEGPGWVVGQWFGGDEVEEDTYSEELVYTPVPQPPVTTIPSTALIVGGLAVAGLIIALALR